MKANQIQETNKVIKAANKTYFVFYTMTGIPTIVWFVNCFKNQSCVFPEIIIFLFILDILIYFWISAFNLKLENDVLLYHSLFSRTVSIRLSEIKDINIYIGCKKYSDRFKPTVRMEVVPKDKKEKTMIISMRVFNSEEMKNFLCILNEKIKKYGLSIPE